MFTSYKMGDGLKKVGNLYARVNQEKIKQLILIHLYRHKLRLATET